MDIAITKTDMTPIIIKVIIAGLNGREKSGGKEGGEGKSSTIEKYTHTHKNTKAGRSIMPLTSKRKSVLIFI
jgi:hypothetical protein